MQIPCLCCQRMLNIELVGNAYRSEGQITLNLPGVLCAGSCIDEMLDQVPDPPGLISVYELSCEDASAALLEISLLTSPESAAAFFLNLFPSSAGVIRSAAIHLHISGEIDLAYRVLEEYCRGSDNPHGIMLELAGFYGRDGKPKAALCLLEEIPEKTTRYHVIKGNVYRQAGEWSKASECWKKATITDPSDKIAWYCLGHYLMHIKKSHFEAEKHFRCACQIFPEERKLRAYVGDSLFFQGKKDDAYKEYMAAMELEEEDDDFEISLKKMIEACIK